MNRLRSAVLAALLVLPAAAPAADHASAATAAVPASQSLDQILSPLTDDPLFDKADVAIDVVDVRTGTDVFSRQADKQLNPASTMKVLTSAAALKTLGPAYRFSTDIYVDGPVQEGVLQGNLYVQGHGDPTMVVEKLWKMVDDIKLQGIDRIAGDVVYDASFFDGDASLHGWDKQEDIDDGPSYFARLGALSLNFNTVALVVGPGSEPGAPGFLGLETPASSYVTLDDQVVTGPATSWARLKIEREATDGGITFRVEGSVPLDYGRHKFYRTVEQPTAHFAAAFQDMLKRVGIQVGGKHRRAEVPDDATLLFTVRSPALAAILMDMNKFSNNFMAEQITKTMGAEVYGVPGTTAKGVKVIHDYLRGLGLKNADFTVVNGSGLTRDAFVAPRDFTKVLVAMAHDPQVGHEFMASLAIAGEDGTLWRRLTDDPGRLRGKTGTIDGVHCLTGYLEAGDGQEYAFAFLVNDVRGSLSKVKSLQDRFAMQVFQVGAPDVPEVVDQGD